MNYEKIIVELLARIQVLEEKVDELVNSNSEKSSPQKTAKITTKDIRGYIQSQKQEAKSKGQSALVLRASDIHRVNRLKNAMPMVCNAMRQCMEMGDVVLHETPSGYSSSLEIKYML